MWKYIERGYDKVLVLVPGWAMGCEIFNRLDMEFNYILPTQQDFYCKDFNKRLFKEPF